MPIIALGCDTQAANDSLPNAAGAGQPCNPNGSEWLGNENYDGLNGILFHDVAQGDVRPTTRSDNYGFAN